MEDQDRMEKYVELVRRYGQLKLPDHDKEMILILQLHRLEGEMDHGDVIDAIAECVCDDSVLDQDHMDALDDWLGHARKAGWGRKG